MFYTRFRRSMLTVLMCLIAVGFCACTNKELETKDISNQIDGEDQTTEIQQDQTENYTDAEEQPAENTQQQMNFKQCVEAFRDFYSDFYMEHRDDDLYYEGTNYDCQAKIIMDGDNIPYLAIADYRYIGEDVVGDLYLYEYNGEEVTVKAYGDSILYNSAYTRIYCIENEIFFCDTPYDSDQMTVYGVKDSDIVRLDYENVEGVNSYNGFYENVEIPRYDTGLGVDGSGANYIIYQGKYSTQKAAFFSNNIYCDCIELDDVEINMSGTDFKTFLDKICEENIQNNLDLYWLYRKYYSNEGDDQNQGYLIWQDGIYYFIYEDGTARVYAVDDGYDSVTIPETVRGYEVISVGMIGEEYSGEIVEGLTVYLWNKTSITIPDSVTEMCIDVRADQNVRADNFSVPEGVKQLEISGYITSLVIPEGIEKLTICDNDITYLQLPDDFNEDSTVSLKSIDTILFCNECSNVQKYAEEEGYRYVIGSIEENLADAPIIPDQYTQNKVNEALKAYRRFICNEIADTEPSYLYASNYSDYYYSLIYVDDDEIPELLIESMDGSMAFNYNNGEVDCFCRSSHPSFGYREKSGYYWYAGFYYDENYYKFEDGSRTFVAGSEVAGFAENHDYCEYNYFINDEEVTQEEFDRFVKTLSEGSSTTNDMKRLIYYQESAFTLDDFWNDI